jgi:hypothetical protein
MSMIVFAQLLHLLNTPEFLVLSPCSTAGLGHWFETKCHDPIHTRFLKHEKCARGLLCEGMIALSFEVPYSIHLQQDPIRILVSNPNRRTMLDSVQPMVYTTGGI